MDLEPVAVPCLIVLVFCCAWMRGLKVGGGYVGTRIVTSTEPRRMRVMLHQPRSINVVNPSERGSVGGGEAS